MSGPRPTADLRLTCQPTKAGNTLVFTYQVANRGPADIYVMDALPSLDPASRQPKANEQAAVVLLGAADDAVVGKFLAPMPTERRMAMPTIPLARLVPAEGLFEGKLTVPLPLAETSPYYSDLPLRQYDVLDIAGVVFSIGYWVAGVDSLAAVPVDYAPGLVRVVTLNTAASAAIVTQRFPTTRLQLFKRKDAFPREIGKPG